MKKVCAFFILTIFSNISFGQSNTIEKSIDSIVYAIDRKQDSTIEFRWFLGHYKVKGSLEKPTKMIHFYDAGLSNLVQTFYIADGKLIYYIDQSSSYYLYGEGVYCDERYYLMENKILTIKDSSANKENFNCRVSEAEVFKNYTKAITAQKAFLIHSKKNLSQTK